MSHPETPCAREPAAPSQVAHPLRDEERKQNHGVVAPEPHPLPTGNTDPGQPWPDVAEGSFYSRHMRTTADRPRVRHAACVIATVGLTASACASSGSDTTALIGTEYRSATEAICADTNSRLDGLPSPPDGISATDWADEVALAFSAESQRTGDLLVDSSIRSTHLDFVTTTTELADSYSTLSATITDDPDGIGAISTEITELTLGRSDLAAELGLDECVRLNE